MNAALARTERLHRGASRRSGEHPPAIRCPPHRGPILATIAAIACIAASPPALAAPCARIVVADIVAIDQPLMFNRLGAQNINGMVFALERDVVDADLVPLAMGGQRSRGEVLLRPDKRPRPLVLRIAAGDCLRINLTNLLTDRANPRNADPAEMQIDDQVEARHVGFHVQGMQAVGSVDDLASYTGRNANALVPPGGSRSYTLYGEYEGVYVATSYGATFGGEGTAGNIGNGLFGQVIVLPRGARAYRNVVTEEELRLSTTGRTPGGHPVIDYEARYPMTEPWRSEGKAGKPILAMLDGHAVVHAETDAIVMGPNADGSFPPSTYPLESQGRRNPTLPNRLEPFRDFAIAFHDEVAVAQAFPGFFDDPVFGYVLSETRDAFMINYGSGGIGSEILANRLGVGPMHDCLHCAYEEFFLSSHVLGDPALLVDVPANVGLEGVGPGEAVPADAQGIKATRALYPADPSNVHHSYIGDHVKMRNTHVGKEQHIFHLHNHQWLFNPNDDNANYIDAQGIGPGSGYTYEIAFGGSGNRNRTAGDAIYHCHFYPHFAQGMWYLWRIHDAFEQGTRLAVSEEPVPAGSDLAPGYHSRPFALRDGTPAPGARALPDGEIVAGTPIPAIVPLPGKAMPPMPGKVTVAPKVIVDPEGEAHIVGSVARVDRSDASRNGDGSLKNPGFPFWIAGLEYTVGQRPTTPPLDMLDPHLAQQLRDSGDPLWAAIDPAQAGGWDGGLSRYAFEGYRAGGESVETTSALDFKKLVTRGKPKYFPEQGTDLEQAAMAFHAKPSHPSYQLLPGASGSSFAPADFRTNGSPPVPGAPYFEPCIDDRQVRLTAGAGEGHFFSGESLSGMSFRGASPFGADNPRVYKGVNIQFDAVFNKVGYHYPQQRILTLWEDAWPVINKQKPPEPLVMRLNTFDCAMYHHANLVPAFYELDDFQVRTPTDVIGQHIHLPKWDLTAADGAANGWNYEDGTLSPAAVVESIDAIRAYYGCAEHGDPRDGTASCPLPRVHPYFGRFDRPDWLGARTTLQRWFADPVVNVHGIDRGLGNIFTHDHYGPSTHQQVGLYATVLTQPAGSTWYHSETGELLYDPSRRMDGGPTSWQAVIATGDLNGDARNDSYREFFLEYSDFQHAYEAGVYVGAGPDGIPDATRYPATADTFRYAVNPPARNNASPVLPDLVVELAAGVIDGCPLRPCPQAISGDDPGMFAVNYRNEPIGLRIYDPDRIGPDGKRGMQAAGPGGDLAFAFQSRTDRAIPEMNLAPSALRQVRGPTGRYTTFPPHINAGGDLPGDPFTPLLRTYSGDNVRIRIQAGAHEEEHNVTIHGIKWLQGGSGHGYSPNSGWKSAQAAGISEQFTFAAPVVMTAGAGVEAADYLYAIDASTEGYWSGVWGIMRNYTTRRADLFALPNNPRPVAARNAIAFDGVCPRVSPDARGRIGPTPTRSFDIVVALANDILPNAHGVAIGQPGAESRHVGAALDPSGGTLVYNPRPTAIPEASIEHDGVTLTLGGKSGPLHDPTAILYVRKDDLDSRGKLRPGVPVEPLILRVAAGDCIRITLENRLPEAMPDLPTFAILQGAVKRDRFDALGSTTFNNNLIRPSAHAGLHAQLLAYDVTASDGTNVGINPVQTVPPRAGAAPNRPGNAPGQGAYPSRTYQYYAGDLRREGLPVPGVAQNANRNVDNILATAVEFGGFNLQPADLIKQTQKGLGGTMVVLPQGARWSEDSATRAAATVRPVDRAEYRDFALVWQRGLDMRWADGTPVENIAAEGPGVPEDPQDNSGVAINYRTEPLWFRFGRSPDAPFGRANGQGLADIPDAHRAYSNALVGGDPATPVLRVARGAPFRIHVVMPSGGSRNTTFALHGHVWPREPYLAERVDPVGYPYADYGVGSVRIGANPMAMYLGGQENVLPAAHWSFVFPSAGGVNAIPGDYLYRDVGSFGNLSGFWGILRVE